MRAIRDLAIIFGAAIALQTIVTSCRPTPAPVLHAVDHPGSCRTYEKGDRIRIDHEEVEVVDVLPGRLIVKRPPDAVAHKADVTLLCLPTIPWPEK